MNCKTKIEIWLACLDEFNWATFYESGFFELFLTVFDLNLNGLYKINIFFIKFNFNQANIMRHCQCLRPPLIICLNLLFVIISITTIACAMETDINEHQTEKNSDGSPANSTNTNEIRANKRKKLREHQSQNTTIGPKMEPKMEIVWTSARPPKIPKTLARSKSEKILEPKLDVIDFHKNLKKWVLNSDQQYKTNNGKIVKNASTNCKNTEFDNTATKPSKGLLKRKPKNPLINKKKRLEGEKSTPFRSKSDRNFPQKMATPHFKIKLKFNREKLKWEPALSQPLERKFDCDGEKCDQEQSDNGHVKRILKDLNTFNTLNTTPVQSAGETKSENGKQVSENASPAAMEIDDKNKRKNFATPLTPVKDANLKENQPAEDNRKLQKLINEAHKCDDAKEQDNLIPEWMLWHMGEHSTELHSAGPTNSENEHNQRVYVSNPATPTAGDGWEQMWEAETVDNDRDFLSPKEKSEFIVSESESSPSPSDERKKFRQKWKEHAAESNTEEQLNDELHKLRGKAKQTKLYEHTPLISTLNELNNIRKIGDRF